jgi:parallel beta-helix repeat protein
MKTAHITRMTLTAVLAVLMIGGSVWARDYYVATDGNDKNPGTLEKPLKNPVAAAAKLQPGDSLVFRAGTYRCSSSMHIALAPSRSGEKGKPITFRTHNNEHVRIDTVKKEHGVSNNGYSWIVFDGFEIFNGVMNMRFGRGSGGYGSHITVRNCLLRNSGREANFFASDTPNITLENNIFQNASRSHGVYLAKNCHNAVIRNNTSINNRGNSGMQLRGGVKNMVVERNILSGNAQGFSLSAGVFNSTFRNNVIYNNGFKGPRGSGWREIIFDPAGDNLIENNTFVNTMPNGHTIMNLVRSKPGSKNTIFRNNIFVAKGKPLFTLEGFEGFVFENNLLYNIGGGQQVNGKGKLVDFAKANGLKESGTITADPKFADLAKGDLRLAEGSPAIDAGAETESEAKVEGKARDIGAYEFGSDMVIGAQLPWKPQQK